MTLTGLLLSLLTPYSTLAKGEIDPISGLVIDSGFEIVRAHCMACHSAKLVTQNRMTRENWLDTLRWMQKSQGLWDLAENEKVILDYLAANYSPIPSSRRPPIPANLMPPSSK
ncbi:hypothetical protein OAP14_05660 [Aliiglaciecola sp.]|nr:hypothetical protein [Aliiglaciecola sp.]